jgi:hypothetical protein
MIINDPPQDTRVTIATVDPLHPDLHKEMDKVNKGQCQTQCLEIATILKVQYFLGIIEAHKVEIMQ